jgi:hypothetical protein
MAIFDTNLINKATVENMVLTYQQTAIEIDDAYARLKAAEKKLESVFGDGSFSTLTREYFDHDRAAEEVRKKIKRSAWRGLLDMLEIRKFLSVRRAKEFDEQLEDPANLPEIELEAIYEMFSTLVSSSTEFAREAVFEVYEFLRPHARSSAARYKTNQKHARVEIGKKVILTGLVEPYWGGYRVYYSREQDLIALDKVFFMLDGKGIPDGYRSPLVDAINTVGKEGNTGETEYFRFKLYKNSNLHLEFRRMDLIQKLNAVAGGRNLKSDHPKIG